MVQAVKDAVNGGMNTAKSVASGAATIFKYAAIGGGIALVVACIFNPALLPQITVVGKEAVATLSAKISGTAASLTTTAPAGTATAAMVAPVDPNTVMGPTLDNLLLNNG